MYAVLAYVAQGGGFSSRYSVENNVGCSLFESWRGRILMFAVTAVSND